MTDYTHLVKCSWPVVLALRPVQPVFKVVSMGQSHYYPKGPVFRAFFANLALCNGKALIFFLRLYLISFLHINSLDDIPFIVMSKLCITTLYKIIFNILTLAKILLGGFLHPVDKVQ